MVTKKYVCGLDISTSLGTYYLPLTKVRTVCEHRRAIPRPGKLNDPNCTVLVGPIIEVKRSLDPWRLFVFGARYFNTSFRYSDVLLIAGPEK